jgi:predicted nucleic acid-binding protein
MRITSKGQVTIPHEIRERAGLLPHTEIDLSSTANSCASSPYRGRDGSRPSPLPDFFIGAHAAVTGFSRRTRDTSRHRT